VAKVLMPLLSGEVRGRLGEIVFFTRKGKQLARMRTIPNNPKTDKQMAVRENLAGLAKLFKGEGNIKLKKFNPTTNTFDEIVVEGGLTEVEREAWMNEGRKRKKDGRLVFIGDNISLLREGNDLKRTP